MRTRRLCGIMGIGLLLGVWLGGIQGAKAQESSETIRIVGEGGEEKASDTQTGEATPTEATPEKPQAKKEGDTQALEKIVVTATKTPRNPDDIPASITVVTSKDIEQQNIQTVDQALKQVPGTTVRRGKGLGDTLANVNLRGFPSSNQTRTLALLDGQTIASGYTNSAYWAGIPVDDIDRIEVVRGPFSALYGGNAMGGVINIITKTPKKLEMAANVGYGRYDYWNYYLSAGNRFWDKLSLKASYTYQYTSGYPTNLVQRTASTGASATRVTGFIPTTTTTNTPTYRIGDTGDNSSYTSTVATKLSWDIADGHKLDFNVQMNWNEYGYGQWHTYLRNLANGSPVATGTARLGDSALRFSTLRESNFLSGDGREHAVIYNLNSEHRLTESTNLKLRGGLMNQPHNWYTSAGTTAFRGGGPGELNSTPSKLWSGEVQIEQALGTRHALTGGVAIQADEANSKVYQLENWRNPDSKLDLTSQSGGRDFILGFYLQDEITWHPMFSTVVGARLDRWKTYDGMFQLAQGTPIEHLKAREEVSFNPKAAFLFRPYDWMSWRASVGTTFRPPNVYELYRTWRSSTGSIYKGNPKLSPEKAVSWELGTTLKPFTGNVITATFFDNHISDLIYRVDDKTDPTGRTSIYKNSARARIMGLEVEMTQQVFSWLNLFGNLTMVDARILKDDYDPEIRGKKIAYVPRQQINFGFNAKYWIFNYNMSGRYVSKMTVRDDNADWVNGVYGSYDPFFTLDAKLTVTPVKYFNVSFSVDNMLNRQYYYYYPTPGRTFWVQAGLKY